MTTTLQKAAQAVIDRWDSPAWKDQPHTAEYVNELRKALDAELQQAVEPAFWLNEFGQLSATRGWAERNAPGSRLTPLYLHPPQQAKPKTMGDVQEMCIAALQRDERAKVGDSRFESWYSELNQAGKGSKQIVREAYEAGLNEADAQQAKQVPMSDERIEEEWYSTSSDQAFYDFANGVRLAEKHHGIGGEA